MYEINYNLTNKKDKDNYIGKIFNSNNYGDFIVLGVYDLKGTAKRYICKFIDSGFCCLSIGMYIRNGKVCDKTKVGKITDNDLLYWKWKNIKKRTIKQQDKYYIGVTLSSDWESFTKFKNDYKNLLGYNDMILHPEIKFNIDKDIKIHGNRHYSKDNCILIPMELNNFFTNKQKSNTSGYEGVIIRQYESGRVEYNIKMKINGEKVELRGFPNEHIAYEKYCSMKKDAIEFLLTERFNWLNDEIKDMCRKKLNSQKYDTLKKNA